MGKLSEPEIRMGTRVWPIEGYDVWNPAELVFIISLGGDPQFVTRTLVEANEWISKKVAEVRAAQRLMAEKMRTVTRPERTPLTVLRTRGCR
jgi:hypothetical protein